MSVEYLRRMLRPQSVAVVGAGEKQGSIGRAVMQNLISGGFTGQIFPVHPHYKSVFDRVVFPSIADIGTPVDLAVIATPLKTVPGIIAQCRRADVGGAVIISAGGKESGESGKDLEKQIQRAAAGSRMRIIGPNCVGIASTSASLNASFATHMPLPGKMAFISQSGAIYTAVLDLSIKEKIGFSYFVSLGSMLDVDFGDMIDYLGGDYQVGSIVMYVECLSRFRNFMSAARAVSRVKPIIVLKAGRSSAGASAAASHTGAMAGEDAVYDAAFKRAGIIRVKTFEELFDCAEFIAKQPKPRGSRLAILTNAGGLGVMAADALSDYGGEPARLSPETIERLNEILPPHWSRSNPVDVLGDASPERFRKAVETCSEDREIDGMLVMTAPQAVSDPSGIASELIEVLKNRAFPVFTAWIGGSDVEKGRAIFNQAGIPTLDTPERAVRAFMNLCRYSRNIELLQEIPSRLPRKQTYDRQAAARIIDSAMGRKNGWMTETESKDLLTAYGIPVNPTQIAYTPDQAWSIARQLGLPAVLKINSMDITHKSDMGGVILNLRTETEIRAAFDQIMAATDAQHPGADVQGVTVQAMVPEKGYELIIGAKKDRDFGPVILFGMGGLMTEVFKDRAIALPPLNRLLAGRMMEETKIYQILKGFRNFPSADLTLLQEILIRTSQLVVDFAQIFELDINPLIVSGQNVHAVDARVKLVSPDLPAPMHLAISPYPSRYESYTTIQNGIKLFIRPIRPEDAPIFETFFESLSARSIYYRFFSTIKKLSREMLARYTQIDYDRQIALVAINEDEAGEKMLGVARIIRESDPEKAEFSVLVRDEYQGLGIGAELLSRCLNIAREQNIEKIWGIVLPENTQMIKLGRKLNFEITRDKDSGEYILSYNFLK